MKYQQTLKVLRTLKIHQRMEVVTDLLSGTGIIVVLDEDSDPLPKKSKDKGLLLSELDFGTITAS